jgi:hypothetical protein
LDVGILVLFGSLHRKRIDPCNLQDIPGSGGIGKKARVPGFFFKAGCKIVVAGYYSCATGKE